jgi:hypothetical protein
VNSLLDANQGSGHSGDLRYVINQVDDLDPTTGDATINFSVTGTITLNSSLPGLTYTGGLIGIEGPGAASLTVTLRTGAGMLDYGIFKVDAGAQVNLIGLRVTGGNAFNEGGGIRNEGTLTLTNSSIDHSFSGAGGGIANYGMMTVTNSTIANNIAGQGWGFGGGILNQGTMTVTNSTISYCAGSGGGIANYGMMTVTNSTISYCDGGGIANYGMMTVTNSTIANNWAISSGGVLSAGPLNITNPTIVYNTAEGGASGGLDVWAVRATLDNTIVALNTVGNGTGYDYAPSDIGGIFSSSSDYNLIGTGGYGDLLTDPSHHNQVNVANPGLRSLANNGGPTQTIALLPGSPAIDKGSNALIAIDPATGQPLATDQRGPGFDRIANGTVDIGAFEVQATNHLAVTAQPPASVTAGLTFGLTVTAEDKSGNVLSSFNGTVTVALASNPGGATLGGTLTATAQNGVASFSDLMLKKAGSGYTLLVSASGLGSETTSPFEVTPAAATKLVVTIQPPSKVLASSDFGLVVSAKDPYGNVDTNFSGSVGVAIANNPGGATLSGTKTVTAQSGVATFSALMLDKPGMGYTLKVTSNGLTAATTNPINVTVPQLVVTAQPPGSVTVGAGFGLIVTAEDSSGNVDSSFNSSVAVALVNNPGGATLSGTMTATAQSGVATFSALMLDKPGMGYTLKVTSHGLTAAITSAFNVQTIIAAAAAGWGTQTVSLQTAADGLRLLPTGRNTDLPWLGIQQVPITLAQATTLAAGDVTVKSAIPGVSYGPVTISGSGTSYILTLAQPINTADRLTITIGNATIASFTRRLDVLPGDFNDDGVVNSQDLVGIRNEWMGINGAVPTLIGDINGDGVVDIKDINAVRAKIGTVLPPVS